VSGENAGAKAIALRHLRNGDKTERQMRDFLQARGICAAEAETVLGELKEAGYVDDAACCDRCLEAAVAKGWGREKIRQKLLERGIAPTLAEGKILERISAEAELARGRKTAEALLAGESGPRALRRVAGRLIALGYEAESVEQILEPYARA
jgi:SOS response regulatory protein OraA/RecX